MQEWPKWVFKNGKGRIVQNAAEASALGKEWSENSSGAPEPPGSGMNAPPANAAVPAAYVPVEYPKVLYRTVAGKVESRRVDSAEAEKALKGEWFEHPNCQAPEPTPATADQLAPQPAKALKAKKSREKE